MSSVCIPHVISVQSLVALALRSPPPLDRPPFSQGIL